MRTVSREVAAAAFVSAHQLVTWQNHKRKGRPARWHFQEISEPLTICGAKPKDKITHETLTPQAMREKKMCRECKRHVRRIFERFTV